MDTNSEENLAWISENTVQQFCETGDVSSQKAGERKFKPRLEKTSWH